MPKEEPLSIEEAEEEFNKIKQSSEQYSTEIIYHWSSIKVDILEILENYRPIKKSDYQYGFGPTGLQNKSYLIVHEFNDDPTKVREYRQTSGKQWYCCECKRQKYGKIYLLIRYGIVFVAKIHGCQARDLSIVMSVQEFLKAGKDPNVGYRSYEDGEMALTNQGESSETKDVCENVDVNESNLAAILQSPEEYSTESSTDWNSIKPELLEILKIYRPIKLCNFQYGLNEHRRENSRLIIFEFENDKTKVREYHETTAEKEWYCCECIRRENFNKKQANFNKLKSRSTRILRKFGILFVKINHACFPRELSIVMSIQEFLRNKKYGFKIYHREQKKFLKAKRLNRMSKNRM